MRSVSRVHREKWQTKLVGGNLWGNPCWGRISSFGTEYIYIHIYVYIIYIVIFNIYIYIYLGVNWLTRKVLKGFCWVLFPVKGIQSSNGPSNPAVCFTTFRIRRISWSFRINNKKTRWPSYSDRCSVSFQTEGNVMFVHYLFYIHHSVLVIFHNAVCPWIARSTMYHPDV